MSVKAHPFVILFGGWGRERTILRVQAAGYEIRAVLTPKQVKPKLEASIQHLRAAGTTILSCDRADLRSTLQRFQGGVLLSIGFPYLVPDDVLKLFTLSLNVHPTLLPRYRGPTSGPYILMSNEKESGSTVHLMEAGPDTGPIVLQRTVPLSRFDTIRSLRRKVYAIEPNLVVDTLALLDTPGFKSRPQDESQATWYPTRRKPEDSEIDPTKSLLDVYDQIRACDPDEFPAYFYIEGQKVCIRLWRPQRPVTDDDDML
jgi:methionyl-tRNA formyltransferase